MEFPISRERLQNIREEYEHVQRIKYIDSVVEYVTNLIIRHAYSFMKRTITIRFTDIAHNNKSNERGILTIQSCIDIVIDKLHENFPDTTITIDPAKTYLYVDWS
jgi:hypothetical protein